LTVESRKGATDAELRKSRNDVVTGMLFSNLIIYFVILTTAATLYAHGKTAPLPWVPSSGRRAKQMPAEQVELLVSQQADTRRTGAL
jgi:hypothetical protein